MIFRKEFYYQYNLDALTYKFGRLGDPMGMAVQGKWGAATAGSSTTVTSTASGYAFSPVNVGDRIIFRTPPDTTTLRKVATKTSPQEITVDSAVNLGAAGVAWDFVPFHVGATDADGWQHVRNDIEFSVFLDIATLAASGGVSVKVQGLPSGSLTPIDLIADGETAADVVYTTTGTRELRFSSPVMAIRVGLKAITSFAGTDNISAWVQERAPKVNG